MAWHSMEGFTEMMEYLTMQEVGPVKTAERID